MNRKNAVAITLVVSCLAASCDNVKNAPPLVEADGQTYIACRNLVWISSEGGLLGGEAGFKVSYTDSNGLGHVIKGIKKLSISDLPKTVPASFPYPLPDATLGTDREGNHFKEGNIYSWSDGGQARLKHGEWKPVMRPNTACQSD